MNRDAVVGTLLGTAVGDALGLPYEGLSKRRAAKLLGPPDRYRFLFGRGMVSDDTEHACMVARAFIASGGDVDAFGRSLARQLRGWLLCLPAGTGLATLRATARLLIGVPYTRSGVKSAGNGPAMRSAILGVVADDPAPFVRVAANITHTDPRAYHGAMAVALAARASATNRIDGYRDDLADALGEVEMVALVDRAIDSVAAGETTESFAGADGVSGFVNETVPASIHAWLSHPDDFRSALTAIIRCGGDADTTAAIVGGIVGAGVGRAGIPAEWIDRLIEWPRTPAWLELLATQVVASGAAPLKPIGLPLWGVLPRNLWFLAVVLMHGFRRLLPPY